MYHPDTEMIYPLRVTPTLKGLRGAAWRRLVEQVSARPADHPDALAFGLLMIRLNGCVSCHADSYRALRGCTACAQNSVARCRESDEALVKRFKQALQDVEAFVQRGVAIEG